MKITEKRLRQIIKEEMQRFVEGRPMTNEPPPRNSNWRRFADALDIGILDLSEIAYDLGFGDFYDMDVSIGPRALSQRDPTKFVTAVQNHSLKALDLNKDEILRLAVAPDYELPPGHPLAGMLPDHE